MAKKIHLKKCKVSSETSETLIDMTQLENVENLKKCPHCPLNLRKLYNGNREPHNSRKHKDVTFVEINSLGGSTGATPGNISLTTIETTLAQFNRNVRIIKRIPKSSSIAAAYELARLMDNCVSNNNLNAWNDLLCFQIPTKKSKSESLARLVKNNIKNFTNPQIDHTSRKNSNKTHRP